MLCEEAPEREIGVGSAQQSVGIAVEADNVAQHLPHRRVGQISTVRKDRVQARRPVRKAVRGRSRISIGHTEAHLGNERFDAELFE